MKLTPCLLILFLFVHTTTFAQSPYTYSQPETLTDGWKTASIHELDIDTTRIQKLFEQVNSGKNKLHSALLVIDNKLIIEEYFNKQTADQQHDLRSVTKSITSLLLGIAIDKGFIDSVDDPVSKYVTDPAPKKNKDPRKSDITIRHLITMSSGMDCNDGDKKSKGQEDRVYKKKDWLQYFMDLPMINDPGAVSNYCTMGQILMTEIVSRASDMPIDQFADTYLFSPLGITNLSWGHTSKKKVIASGKRLYMIPRDMAKLGQLILNKGKWNDQQIISEEWIEQSTADQIQLSGIGYGFLWWNIPMDANGKKVIAKSATGNGGQYIMVLPELNMVAVFTGGAYNSEEGKLPFAIMKDIFLWTFAPKE